jgi:hypothetical protein
VADVDGRPAAADDVVVEVLAGAEAEPEAPPLIAATVAACWATIAGW